MFLATGSRGQCLFKSLCFIILMPRSIAQDSFSGCDLSSYYEGLSGTAPEEWKRAELHDLIRNTHRQALPYTSSTGGDDVWKALIDLDGVESVDASGETQTMVRLIYRNILFPAIPFGDSATWNREHIWPKSRGVETGGMDFTDVFHLKPADANVNTARSNKYFGGCGFFESLSECRIPANGEAAEDTATDGTVWLPPAASRGDIARSLFYMDLRYDGLDGEDLVLTDCPTNNDNEMAYLSQLLEWHWQDLPDAREEARNNRTCERWQGNRNPFIDFPQLATTIFGEPKSIVPGQFGYNCTAGGEEEENPVPTNGTCVDLKAGDVMVVLLNSDNPDSVGLVALENIPGGIDIYLTDNAWTGTTFRSNEGTLKLTVPESGIKAGNVMGYGDSLLYASSWDESDAGFALAAAGDTVLVYCQDENSGDIVFLGGLSYSDSWAPGGQSEYETSTSALPSALVDVGSVALPHMDNYVYDGTRSGTKRDLQMALALRTNWVGSNSERHSTNEMSNFLLSGATKACFSALLMLVLLPALLVSLLLI